MRMPAKVIAISGSLLLLIMSTSSILRDNNANQAAAASPETANSVEQRATSSSVTPLTPAKEAPVKKQAQAPDTRELVFEPLGNITEFMKEHPETRIFLEDDTLDVPASGGKISIARIDDRVYFLFNENNGYCGSLGCSLTGFSKTADGYVPALNITTNLPLRYNIDKKGTTHIFLCGPDNSVSKWSLGADNTFDIDRAYIESTDRPQCANGGSLPDKIDIDVPFNNAAVEIKPEKQLAPTEQLIETGKATAIKLTSRQSIHIADDYPLIAEAMLPPESPDGSEIVQVMPFPDVLHEALVSIPDKKMDVYVTFTDRYPWCISPELCEITLYKRDGKDLVQILSVNATKESYLLAEQDSISLIVCNKEGKYMQWRMADGSIDTPIGPDHPEYFEMVGEYKGTDIKTTCPAPAAAPKAPKP